MEGVRVSLDPQILLAAQEGSGVQTRLGYIGCTSTLFGQVMLTSASSLASQTLHKGECGLRDYTQSLAQIKVNFLTLSRP